MTNQSVAIKRVAFAFGHLVVATAGVAISTAICFFLFKPIFSLFVSRTSSALNLALRFQLFPLQTAFGFVAGYASSLKQNAFAQDRSARYVWIIPTVWFMLFFLSWSPASILLESRWDHFFWSDLPESKRLQLVTTLPFLTSVAYALGSYAGIRRGITLPLRHHD